MSEVIRALVEQNGSREEKEIFKEQNGFDGMTGEPVYVFRIANGFDGMTGEPLFAEVESAGFDPMTGQPLYRVKSNSPLKEESLRKIKSLSMPKDFKKFLPLIYGVGGALIVLLIVLICISNGLFLSNRYKVLRATYKTIEDSTFGEMALNAGELFSSKELTTTVSAQGSVYGYGGSVNATVAQNRKKGKISANADLNVSNMFSQQMNFYFDDSSIRASLPEINDEVYVYNYKKAGKGALANLVRDNTDGSIEDVNTALTCINNMYKSSGKYGKNLKSKLLSAYKNVEVERIDPEEFKVDGKRRKCKGYEMHLTEENLADFVAAVSKGADETYRDDVEEMLYALASLTGEDDVISEYDRLEDGDQIAQMMSDGEANLDIDFYIYKGKLAAICYSDDYARYSIEFQGGDRRCSNIEATMRRRSGDKKQTIALESSISKNKEKGQIYMDNVSAISYTYDLKNGNYHVDAAGVMETDGTLLIKKNSMKLQMEAYGPASLDLELDVKNKARISEPKGEVINIADLDEDDLERTVTRIANQIMSQSGALDNLF